MTKELTPPKVISTETIQEGFVKIRIDTLELPSKEQHRYYSLDAKSDAVLIIGLTSVKELVLIEEYRHPTGKILLSAAGGYIEKGEDVLAAAEREFLEETGFRGESYQFIGHVYPYPGLSSQKIYFVLAQNAAKTAEPQHEPLELLRVSLKKESELKQEMIQGVDLDGVFCAALAFYHMRKENN